VSLDELDDAQLGEWFERMSAAAEQDFPATSVELAYGDHPLQVIDLWGDQNSAIWVASIHGGYFAAEYDRSVNEPLSRRLAASGMLVANIDYRRQGSCSDPADTTDDVRAATAHVVSLAPTGTRVLVTGHSAGGYLTYVAAEVAGAHAALALAPVTHLRNTAAGGWDDGAIARWLGGSPDEIPEVWDRMELTAAQLSAPHLRVVHGVADRVVPISLTRESITQHRPKDGHNALLELADVGHYEFLDPSTSAATVIVEQLQQLATLPPTTSPQQ
jgi:acetyl esterase/lipase